MILDDSFFEGSNGKESLFRTQKDWNFCNFLLDIYIKKKHTEYKVIREFIIQKRIFELNSGNFLTTTITFFLIG